MCLSKHPPAQNSKDFFGIYSRTSVLLEELNNTPVFKPSTILDLGKDLG